MSECQNCPNTKNRSLRSPLTEIRRHCLECVGGISKEVTLCTSKTCRLYPYRFGEMPHTARKHGKNVDPISINKITEVSRGCTERT